MPCKVLVTFYLIFKLGSTILSSSLCSNRVIAIIYSKCFCFSFQWNVFFFTLYKRDLIAYLNKQMFFLFSGTVYILLSIIFEICVNTKVLCCIRLLNIALFYLWRNSFRMDLSVVTWASVCNFPRGVEFLRFSSNGVTTTDKLTDRHGPILQVYKDHCLSSCHWRI